MKYLAYLFVCIFLYSCNSSDLNLAAIRGAGTSVEETSEVSTCLGDFNGDGFINSSDLSILLGAVNTSQSQFDLNQDGIVDQHDVDWLSNHFGICQDAIYPGACAVDLNDDGHINAGDLGIFLSQFGQEGEELITDFDGSGVVDVADQQIILSYMGQSVSCETNDYAIDSCLGDLNQDGVINGDDLAILLSSVGTSDVLADLNADGIVDQDDVDWLNNHTGTCEGAIYPGPCAADFNNDGVINAADLSILIAQIGSVGEGLVSDLDQNGVVDAADLQILQSYYFQAVTCQ